MRHNESLRRALVGVSFVLALAWLVFAIVFLLEIQDQRLIDVTALALGFTIVIGALVFTALGLFLAAPRQILVSLDASHLAGACNLFATSIYVFGLIMGFAWRLAAWHEDVGGGLKRVFDVFAFFASGVAAIVAVFGTSIFSGMLAQQTPCRAVVPVSMARAPRRTHVKRETSTQSIFADDEMSSGGLVAPPFGFEASGGAAASATRADSRSLRSKRASSYVFTPYPQLPRANALHITSYLCEAFLFVMSFLALLQSQHVHVISNLWSFTIVYGVLGLLLVATQILSMLNYVKTYPDLTFRHMLPLNTNLVSTVLVWTFSLFTLAIWLGEHAPGECCGSAAARPVGDHATVLYYNALLVVAVLGVLGVATFVPAATAHAHPERRLVDPIDVSRK